MRVSFLMALGWMGCSESRMDRGASAEAMNGFDVMDTGLVEDGAAETMEEPSYWRLSGTLLVNDGAIQPELSFLRVLIVGDADAALCDDNVGIEASTLDSETPEAGIHAWWEVIGTDPSSSSCLGDGYDNPLPNPVYLGLGPMHPEIEAVVTGDPELVQMEGSRVRSVYASMARDASIWVFGVAETTSEEEVDIDPNRGGISVDGNWKFEAVYSFPLSD